MFDNIRENYKAFNERIINFRGVVCMKQNTNYDGIAMEKLYADGRYIATVYYDDYAGTYKVCDERYDYYEGRNYNDEEF